MFCAKLESVQFRNCPAQSRQSHFVAQSGNSYPLRKVSIGTNGVQQNTPEATFFTKLAQYVS